MGVCAYASQVQGRAANALVTLAPSWAISRASPSLSTGGWLLGQVHARTPDVVQAHKRNLASGAKAACELFRCDDFSSSILDGHGGRGAAAGPVAGSSESSLRIRDVTFLRDANIQEPHVLCRDEYKNRCTLEEPR